MSAGKRWEDSREALAAIDSITASRGVKRAEIIAALADPDVRNAIVEYVIESRR